MPPQILANQPCKEHILNSVAVEPGDWPSQARGREVRAFVIVGYDLEPSGRASNIRILQSEPNRTFDAVTLENFSRTTFATGISAVSCRHVASYASVRRP
ncbi:energy transducer TonB [Massilia glaciei]|uniref:energy transducer TonB n=1 Tax=Massilia glaciei TaxID=1524097 RepID=UPI00351D1A98